MTISKSFTAKVAGVTAAAVTSTLLSLALPAGAFPVPQAPTNAKMQLAPVPGATLGVLAATDLSWDAVTQDHFSSYAGGFFSSTGQPVSLGGTNLFGGSTTNTSAVIPGPIGNSLPSNPTAPTSLNPPFSNGLGIVANYQNQNLGPHGLAPVSAPAFFVLKPVTAMPIFRIAFPWHSSTMYSSETSSIAELALLLSTFGSSCDLTGAKSINATVTLVGRTNGNISAERDSSLSAARIRTVKAALMGVYGSLGKPVHFKSENLGDTLPLGSDKDVKWRQADRSVTIELTTTNSPELACAG